MKVGMIDNEILSIGSGKIIRKNPLKRNIGENTWIKREELGMGIRCATIATREIIFNIFVINGRETFKT